MEYNNCVSLCPETCDKNHNLIKCDDSDQCKPGCQCIDGFVLDDSKCVNKSACPCHNGGRLYEQGASLFQDCNKWYFLDILLYSWQMFADKVLI